MKQVAGKPIVGRFEKPKSKRSRLPEIKTSTQRLRDYSQRRKFNFLTPVTCEEK